MNISVILATYKRIDTLSKTLESFCQLNTEGISWEVILVDNADDSETKELVSQYSKRIPISYYVEYRRGKNNALNFAVTVAQGELFVFTDDDVLVDQEWLQEFYAGAQRWKEYSVFGGKILPDWPSSHDMYSDLEEHFYVTAFAVADWKIEEGVYDGGKVWGPSMMIRRHIFDEGRRYNVQVGPSGKSYIMGSETEFTKRIEKQGFQAIYLPKVLVHHQIRPEQMTKQWLYKRAFNYGRSDVYYEKKDKATMLFSVPRYLYALVIKQFIHKWICYFSGKKKCALTYSVKYWTTRGMIRQHKVNKRTNHDPSRLFNDNQEITLVVKEPLVSVVIPTYNRKDLVTQSIDSVLSQTYKNIEVIVVDDGSQDNTVEYLQEKYNDKISVLAQDNAGNSAARNYGISKAKGHYIAFLDDDDYWLDHKIEEEVNYLQKYPHFSFVYSGTFMVNMNNEIVDERIAWKGENPTFDRLFQNSIVISPSVCLFRRECVDNIQGFDETLIQSSDYDFILRLAKKFPFGYLNKKLSNYRVHEQNLSKNLDRRLKAFLVIFSKEEIMEGKSAFERYMKKAHIFYYIATLCSQNQFYFKAAQYYLLALIRCPIIGFYYWPQEIKSMRFSFLYRILKVYFLVIMSFIKGFGSRQKVVEVKHY